MRAGLAVIFILLLILGGFSCNDRDDNLDAPNIRIRNTSSLNFTQVGINNDSVVYENVGADSFSEYNAFITAFREMPITVVTDSSTLNFTPSEPPLEPLPVGLYTYDIAISETGELVINFKID